MGAMGYGYDAHKRTGCPRFVCKECYIQLKNEFQSDCPYCDKFGRMTSVTRGVFLEARRVNAPTVFRAHAKMIVNLKGAIQTPRVIEGIRGLKKCQSSLPL